MSEHGSDEKRSRRVRFHGRVQFKTIRHVSDFTDEEIRSGWYRKKDFMDMSEEVSEIAQLIAQGQETHNGEELYIRGLEHLVEEDVADYRAEKMIASIDAVLDEQEDQRDEEVNDPAAIARLYTDIATPLQREAYLIGLRDAQEAEAAAGQIADLPPPVQPISPASAKASAAPVPAPAPSVPEQDEEMLLKEEEVPERGKEKPKSPPPKRQKGRKRTGPTELSPLTRDRNGRFAFRNKEKEKFEKEMSRHRRGAVEDALSSLLGDEDDDDDFWKKINGSSG